MIGYRFRMGQAPLVDGRADLTYSPTALAYPLYSNDLSKNYVAEEGRFLFRAKLSGSLKFVSNDFDTIINCGIADVIIVHIDITYDSGTTWEVYHKGSFTKSDCDIDFDNKTITVELSTIDNYSEIIAGLDKEYNLTRLELQTCRVNFTKRPMMQIYVAGDSKITNYINGYTWEQDCNVVSDDTPLVSTYRFARCSLVIEISLKDEGNGGDIPTGALGIYSGNIRSTGTSDFPRYEGLLYNLEYDDFYIQYIMKQNDSSGNWKTEVRLYQDDDIIYRTATLLPGSEFPYMRLYSTTDTSKWIVGDSVIKSLYARILTDKDGLGYALPTNDIVSEQSYKRVFPYPLGTDGFFVSLITSEEPTQWGKTANNKYYHPPLEPMRFVPVGRSLWKDASIWLRADIGGDEVFTSAEKEYTLRDAYPIESIISALLKEVAPSIKHKAHTKYSDFLYSTPTLKGDNYNLVIVPKSSITRGEYSVPAQRAPLTLRSLFAMLENVYQLYWFVDGDKLRIEHIQWFRNGGSYTTAGSATDLTKIVNPRTRQSWGFGQNKVAYQLEDMPERYEFGWMDNSSDVFKGGAIEVLSPAVQLGNIQKISAGDFSSDIDYLLSSPSLVSMDGFVLLAGQYATIGPFETPIISIEPIEESRVYRISGIGDGVSQVECRIYNGEKLLSTSKPFDAIHDYKDVVFPAYADTILIVQVVGRFVPVQLKQVDVCSVPFAKLEYDGYSVVVQNPYASFAYAVPKLWVYDLPAKNVRIFGQQQTLSQTSRTLEQVVMFPTEKDMSPLKLIKTEIGEGQIKEVSVNLQSRMSQITLRYDTE